MKQEPNHNFVIRQPLSTGRRIWNICVFAILWSMVLFVLYVNYGFIFDLYTDNLVTYYLLLNLDYGFYFGLLKVALLFAIGTLLFSFYRLHKIREAERK